jgi:hypothetical protein
LTGKVIIRHPAMPILAFGRLGGWTHPARQETVSRPALGAGLRPRRSPPTEGLPSPQLPEIGLATASLTVSPPGQNVEPAVASGAEWR